MFQEPVPALYLKAAGTDPQGSSFFELIFYLFYLFIWFGGVTLVLVLKEHCWQISKERPISDLENPG